MSLALDELKYLPLIQIQNTTSKHASQFYLKESIDLVYKTTSGNSSSPTELKDNNNSFPFPLQNLAAIMNVTQKFGSVKMFVSTVDACVPGQYDAVEDGVVGRHLKLNRKV